MEQDYDLDHDGVVSDDELRAVETLEKSDAQRRMAWVALVSILIFTVLLFLPLVPDKRVELLGDVSSLFYISMAGVVGAYMGMTAYMTNNRKK
jgi:hypothetical protein